MPRIPTEREAELMALSARNRAAWERPQGRVVDTNASLLPVADRGDRRPTTVVGPATNDGIGLGPSLVPQGSTPCRQQRAPSMAPGAGAPTHTDATQRPTGRTTVARAGASPQTSTRGPATAPATVRASRPVVSTNGGREPGSHVPGSGGASHNAWKAREAAKYRNKPTNGYASKREADRAFVLKLKAEAGEIRNLREQVEFLLIPKQEGERACKYRADFAYDELQHGEWSPVVEDVKGMRTDVYRIKRKLMLMVHGVRVRET